MFEFIGHGRFAIAKHSCNIKRYDDYRRSKHCDYCNSQYDLQRRDFNVADIMVNFRRFLPVYIIHRSAIILVNALNCRFQLWRLLSNLLRNFHTYNVAFSYHYFNAIYTICQEYQFCMPLITIYSLKYTTSFHFYAIN